MTLHLKITIWLCILIVIACAKHQEQPLVDRQEPPHSTAPDSGQTPPPTGSGSLAPPKQTRVSPTSTDLPHRSSCNYFAGKAVDGQAINLDICSIQPGNLSHIPFIYYFGSERVESSANCLDFNWTTYPEHQIHSPQSEATEKMLARVCQR